MNLQLNFPNKKIRLLISVFVLPAAMHVSSCRNESLSQKLQLPPMCEDPPIAIRPKNLVTKCRSHKMRYL